MLVTHFGGVKILRNTWGVLHADKDDYRWMIHYFRLSSTPQISYVYSSMQCTLSYRFALIYYLITSSHQRMNPPSGLIPWRVITKYLKAFLLSQLCVTSASYPASFSHPSDIVWRVPLRSKNLKGIGSSSPVGRRWAATAVQGLPWDRLAVRLWDLQASWGFLL
jgi:hypothetical protein